jgi:hypothetical protein
MQTARPESALIRRYSKYVAIRNFSDTAELLGWYEVVYMDGFI